MAKVEKWFAQDLKKSVPVRYLDGSFFNEDAAGNRIGVEVYSDGEAVTLAGSITGYCVRPDGTTVPISGARSSNRAYIDIPQSALAVPGPLTVTIKNTESSVITTLCAVVGIVTQSRTGVQVNPGQTITDWTNQISAQLQAVQTAADNLGSTLAVPYDSLTFPVTAGTYTVYSGNVYRANQDISTSEEWTADHWTQVKVCNEIYDLKNEAAELAEHFPATGKLQAGIGTNAAANGAVATGVGTTASGRASHAEGQLTTADGQVAHAEGYGTTASGDYSHAEGFGTLASGDHQHAFGKYNVEDTNDTYLEIAGNGTADNARSNARTLDWNGNEALAGDLTVNKGAASEMTVGQELSSLKSAMLLEQDEIPDTVQSIVFDGSGNVQSITHKKRTDLSVTVRTDTFTFAGTVITEVRTLDTGESLTIVTDTDTLVTTVTYAAA